MHDKNAKEVLNLVPTHANSMQALIEDSLDDEQLPCSPRKIFPRHGSLAELSTIAVTEKEALDRQENSQNSDSNESSGSKEQDFGYLCQNVGVQLEVNSTPTKISQIENTPCNDPLTPNANLKVLMSVLSPAIRDREEKRDLFVNNVQNTSDEVVVDKPNTYSRKNKSLGLLCQRYSDKTHTLCSFEPLFDVILHLPQFRTCLAPSFSEKWRSHEDRVHFPWLPLGYQLGSTWEYLITTE